MREIYKDKIEILCQRVPIGLRHALKLLEEFEGDLEKAENQFKTETVNIVTNRIGVTTNIAIRHLLKNKYDVGLAIKSIDEERYSLTELILKKHKDKKEDALTEIMFAIEEKHSLKRTFWLDFDHLKSLPTEVYCLLTIMDWLNYESWEDFDSALTFNLNIVAEQIKNSLSLPELAKSLQQASDIQALVYKQYETSKDIQNYDKANETLSHHREYQQCENDFKIQRPALIDRLYEFVKNNIGKFP